MVSATSSFGLGAEVLRFAWAHKWCSHALTAAVMRKDEDTAFVHYGWVLVKSRHIDNMSQVKLDRTR